MPPSFILMAGSWPGSPAPSALRSLSLPPSKVARPFQCTIAAHCRYYHRRCCADRNRTRLGIGTAVSVVVVGSSAPCASCFLDTVFQDALLGPIVLVGQELTGHGDLHAVALWVG